MVTQITLGNVGQQNGRTVISGSQSGLDTEGLIKALTDAKRQPAVKLEEKNESLDAKTTALTDLKSLLTRFRTAVDTLRNPPGVQNASQNIFEYRTATLSSVLTSSNYLSVTAEPGVNVQNFTINKIEQLAQETKQDSTAILAPDLTSAFVKANGDASANSISAGTFSLRVLDGGADASITLAENDSLQTVVSKFNAVKSRTGIQATVVKVASGSPDSSYKIIFTGTKTGESGAFDMSSASTVTADADGVLAQFGFQTPSQLAQNAEFQLDGVDIERESNTVTDLIDNMTFTLKQPYATTTPITVAIEPDLEIVTNAINQLADVYNELRVFSAKQSEVGDDGLPVETAVLSNNATLRSIVTSVTNEITDIVSGLAGGNPKSLTEIGVNFQDFEGDNENPSTRNIIVINAEKLQSSLSENFQGVRNLFEFSLTSDNPNLTIFKRSNEVSVSSFSLAVNITGGTYTATYAGGTAEFDASDISSGVKLLTGREGTPFAGLQFIYASTADSTVNINLTQGIGDRLYNELDKAITTDGTVPSELSQIDDQKTRNETEITKIDDFIVTYRDQLLDTYAKLESALSSANQLLSLLDAQASARENS